MNKNNLTTESFINKSKNLFKKGDYINYAYSW